MCHHRLFKMPPWTVHFICNISGEYYPVKNHFSFSSTFPSIHSPSSYVRYLTHPLFSFFFVYFSFLLSHSHCSSVSLNCYLFPPFNSYWISLSPIYSLPFIYSLSLSLSFFLLIHLFLVLFSFLFLFLSFI